MAGGSVARPAGQAQRSGDPRRLYGYPRSWLRGDPRVRDPQVAILETLERIEQLLERLAGERLL